MYPRPQKANIHTYCILCVLWHYRLVSAASATDLETITDSVHTANVMKHYSCVALWWSKIRRPCPESHAFTKLLSWTYWLLTACIIFHLTISTLKMVKGACFLAVIHERRPHRG